MKLLDAVFARTTAGPSANEILWPCLTRTLTWLGGGYWHEENDVVTTQFWGEGVVRLFLVRNRLCQLNRGTITVSRDAVLSALPRIWKLWVCSAVASAQADRFRSDPLSTFAPGVAQLVRGKRRKIEAAAFSMGPMPRCVQCALKAKDPWKNKMRWMMAQTLVGAARRAGQPYEPLLRCVELQMEERGDGKGRIKEFRAAALRAAGGRFNRVPCSKRKAAFGGMWCPLDGDTKRCASERGVALPNTADPAPHEMWATQTHAPGVAQPSSSQQGLARQNGQRGLLK
jgi:hypothetical protein